MQGGAESTQKNERGEEVVNDLSSFLKHHLSYTLVTPPLELTVTDSGCTSHLLPATCPCENKVAVLHGGKYVHMPNCEEMVATHTYPLPFTQPPPLAAQKCDVFPALQQTLPSLGQFCDACLTANLDN